MAEKSTDFYDDAVTGKDLVDDEDDLVKSDPLLNFECPICLQQSIHPVKLPCSHIFCFLCIKGVANQSKKCALCRQEIPVDFLNNPVLVRSDDLLRDLSTNHSGYQWFYEGRNGWWQYDERASAELEERLARGDKIFEILIAGFLYILDLDNMIQIRRNDPSRRRRVKRDLASIEKKGVAGIKLTPALQDAEREGAYGEEDASTKPSTSTTNKTDGSSSDKTMNDSDDTPSTMTMSGPEHEESDLSNLVENLNLSGLSDSDSESLVHGEVDGSSSCDD